MSLKDLFNKKDPPVCGGNDTTIDPKAPKNPWDLMPQQTSPYPWRIANDADFDITGMMKPQGEYRSIVWGSGKTHLYSMHPDTYGK